MEPRSRCSSLPLWLVLYSLNICDLRWLPHLIYWSCIRPNLRRTYEAIRWCVREVEDRYHMWKWGGDCLFCRKPVAVWRNKQPICGDCHRELVECGALKG